MTSKRYDESLSQILTVAAVTGTLSLLNGIHISSVYENEELSVLVMLGVATLGMGLVCIRYLIKAFCRIFLFARAAKRGQNNPT